MTPMPTWEEICDDQSLRDLPYKIEQDRYGRIVMSPTSYDHGLLQAAIAFRLRDLPPNWAISPEGAITTSEGIRVPDVVAISKRRSVANRGKFALPEAPEICVEVVSWSNSMPDISEKRRLLAPLGCQEFWICSDEGQMTFLDAATGDTLAASRICPGFPSTIHID